MTDTERRELDELIDRGERLDRECEPIRAELGVLCQEADFRPPPGDKATALRRLALLTGEHNWLRAQRLIRSGSARAAEHAGVAQR